VKHLVDSWLASASPPSRVEIAKRLIDLCLVSVLLDAGAGNLWTYREPGTGVVLGHSEGLAIASLKAFERGAFSGDISMPHRVDGNECL
jgi:hypothetical protein